MIPEEQSPFVILYRWTHQVIDGEHFVDEHCDGVSLWTRYGPIPERTVKPFIDERKQWLEMSVKAHTQSMADRLRLDAMLRYPHAMTGREAK